MKVIVIVFLSSNRNQTKQKKIKDNNNRNNIMESFDYVRNIWCIQRSVSFDETRIIYQKKHEHKVHLWGKTHIHEERNLLRVSGCFFVSIWIFTIHIHWGEGIFQHGLMTESIQGTYPYIRKNHPSIFSHSFSSWNFVFLSLFHRWDFLFYLFSLFSLLIQKKFDCHFLH